MSCLNSICRGRLQHCLVVLLAAVTVYNEWLSLALQAQSWQQLPLRAPPTPDHGSSLRQGVPVRLLFVADPQLLSTITEPYYPFSLLSIWDSNRFMKNGFAAAVEYAKPDIVVFLGDLFNDGSVASDEQFEAMAQKFNELFAVPSEVKLRYFLPGDNDVGGEGSDRRNPTKLARFERAFPTPAPRPQHMFLQLVHVPPQAAMKSPPPAPATAPGVLRLLLSHVPLMPGTAHKKTLLAEQPSLIVSGHHHDSFHFVGTKKSPQATQFWPIYGSDAMLNFTLLGEELHEIVVPTCSYRMGKRSYGYGLAVIDSRGWMEYGVLWLPCRQTQLLIYCLALTFACCLLTLPRFCRAGYLLLQYFRLHCSRPQQQPPSRSTRGYARLKTHE